MKMDIWHKLGRIFRISNLGTVVFFALNIALIYSIFGTFSNVGLLVAFYFLTIVISLSPIGEWFLCIFAGAENIKRTELSH